ncbi:MFS transporter [Gilliamella apicola]|uniref:MFS transporter n=1 Tax=Gilliamella TaxID=1193503 RepID=UPI000A355EC1|nr:MULTISPECIES: MFS transporter [Gilliamella]MBI0028704.1 MFS transporter [Gilliamella sp. B14448G7]MBI0031638.1 MFS transporter [Gilliamella sp. B14384G15]MBI0035391.1 MFS transporter [Gilliamella sp. B14448G11]MBI0042576.1 MFS transporter [Gilliamella sp. B14448G12]MBI0058993.1 MFS transporter [Gilliamella sp. B14384G12]
MKNKYIPTSICLYINYFVHGMGAIILAQNMDYLANQLNTDSAGIAYVISGLGIGRLIVLFVMGALSDKFGRKPFVFLGGLFYIGFLLGILISPNLEVAFLFAILGGIANSTLDAGTYPALMESFPKATGTASILTKAAIAGGQFVLPIVMTMIIAFKAYYGWSFLFCVAILALNALAVLKMPFPNHKQPAAEEIADESIEKETKPLPKLKQKANFWIEGICFIIIGYTSTATFYLVSIWLPKFSESVAMMSPSASAQTISYYAMGTLTSVILTSILVKSLIRPVYIVFVYPCLSAIMLFVLFLFPSPMLCMAGGFILGFTAAGGVLQLALTTMSEFYPEGKGKVLGIFFTSSSLATFSIPVITGIISKSSIANIILLDAFIAVLGTVLASVIIARYHKIFELPNHKLN